MNQNTVTREELENLLANENYPDMHRLARAHLELIDQPLVIRCHKCRGTQIFKRYGNEIEVFHSCAPKSLIEANDELRSQKAALEAKVEDLANCKWCPGVPVNELGNHVIKGYYGSGDGAIPCPRFAVMERDELRRQKALLESRLQECIKSHQKRNAELAALEEQLAEALEERNTAIAQYRTEQDLYDHTKDQLADARRVLGIVAPYHKDCYCNEDDGLSGKCVHCVIIDAAAALRAKPEATQPQPVPGPDSTK